MHKLKRRTLTALLATTAATDWVHPIVTSVLLPAHASTTGLPPPTGSTEPPSPPSTPFAAVSPPFIRVTGCSFESNFVPVRRMAVTLDENGQFSYVEVSQEPVILPGNFGSGLIKMAGDDTVDCTIQWVSPNGIESINHVFRCGDRPRFAFIDAVAWLDSAGHERKVTVDWHHASTQVFVSLELRGLKMSP